METCFYPEIENGHRGEDGGMFHKQEGVVGFETKHCETPRAFPLMGRGRTHRSVAAVCLKERERICSEFERYLHVSF